MYRKCCGDKSSCNIIPEIKVGGKCFPTALGQWDLLNKWEQRTDPPDKETLEGMKKWQKTFRGFEIN